MNELKNSLNGTGLKVAIAVARFNEIVTDKLLDGALRQLQILGVDEKDITVAHVPGAFELPGICRRMADSNKFDAVMALGAVIRGETGHYDVVVNNSTSGIAGIAAEGKVPMILGILTTDTVDQAMNRAGLKAGNLGCSWASTAVEMANLYKQI
ncbi:6,7-dimethyl-8-ribityllumazine synthase [Fibrobacter sp. UWH9]|uniref:6,7-dimethyl-8-ribityllumazine synthase n=1 Tax=unclassified Fibrobacter TaxID=2634177 RepID=UPI00092364B2|nr:MULTISPECIES: 6,7-dimethyl-8-ribityllumazine synthase [Fibrobacter]MCQ2099322.1 6,7-dimethyl-8-ribityllumazine synthase [Fibrobacter sp.]MCL4102382.1 6,7-dimethyl-8-ribityllumazine synthase [Fibrobacter succinogenes]MDO4947104.1 6,7-dimethyl-8-ribityllumazine synthase [Fibrobacter sp.]OWV06719.1 6,7-dimethyl-8-ribityllumazine synthase [Fibrobacter sp. UWH3]OWV17014.1 6,7-dimethyl-8-ribityllumazine synthase [Fibrobacter sp. UWH1]